MDAAALVASGHRYASRVIRMGPIRFGTYLSMAAVLALIIPSRLIGVHSLPLSKDDVGVWWQANWSLMYLVVLPAIFGCFVGLAYSAARALKVLGDRNVIVPGNGASDGNFEEYISRILRQSSRRVTLAAALIAVLLSVVDIATVFAAVHQYRRTGSFAGMEQDWSIAYLFDPDVSSVANIIFDGIAYTVQCVAIFLGFFCLFKFWLFLHAFSISLRDDRHPYEFNPWIYDPERRLGLKPIGRIFNIFLTLVIGFQIYVLAHRIQQIHLRGSYNVNVYLDRLFDGRQTFASVRNYDLYAWHTVDAGTWSLLILMTLPMIAVAYLPLWKLRRYVQQRIESFYDHDMAQLEAAKQLGNKELAGQLEERIGCLLKAQVWPNGDDTGWRLLGATVAISIAAWAPPLFIWLASAGIIGETLRKLLAKRS